MEYTQVGKDLIEIGVKKGLTEGIMHGFSQGKRENACQLLLQILGHKFGKVPGDIANRINSISDDTKLDDLAIKVLDLTDLNQFEDLLN